MKSIICAAVALWLAGCATFSEDGGFGAVQREAGERTGKDLRWARTEAERGAIRKRVDELLAQPLGVEEAVQLALLNNPGLQATYAELGIAEADLVQAGRGPNLRIHALRTKVGDDVAKVEEGFSFDLLGVLLMPMRRKMEARRFERVQAGISAEVVRVAAETRRAWVQAVAAAEAERYFAQVKEAADTGAELARRMAAGGNWPKLQQMREQALLADAVAQQARARQQGIAARERLARLAGLSAEQADFRLPERLPELPAALAEEADLDARAMARRLDVQAAKRETEWVAESVGLANATRFVDALELGRARTKEAGGRFAYGYTVGIEVPVFDWGGARVARAEATYLQAVQRLAEVAVNARSEVRESRAIQRSAYELARHYRDEVVPLRKRISEEVLLRYNGMLTGVFELLADAREQVSAVSGYLDALRDFWLADADLQERVNGGHR